MECPHSGQLAEGGDAQGQEGNGPLLDVRQRRGGRASSRRRQVPQRLVMQTDQRKMEARENNQIAEPRSAPLEMKPEEFRALGYRVVDHVAEFLGSLPSRRVSP